MLQPGLVPTIMAKASKHSAAGFGKEGILPTSKWFNFDLKDDDLEDMCRGFVPKNTVADMEKCVWPFQSWRQARNLCFTSDKVPVDILLMDDHTAHKVALPVQHGSMQARRWVVSIQDSAALFDGNPAAYSKQKENQIKLMTDKEFIVLRSPLDSLYHRLHTQGVGCNAKPTEVLTQEDEEKLWDSGVLYQNTPQGLLNVCSIWMARTSAFVGIQSTVNLKGHWHEKSLLQIR